MSMEVEMNNSQQADKQQGVDVSIKTVRMISSVTNIKISSDIDYELVNYELHDFDAPDKIFRVLTISGLTEDEARQLMMMCEKLTDLRKAKIVAPFVGVDLGAPDGDKTNINEL